MKEGFNESFNFAMKWEGYKTDDSLDQGGKTVFGIAETYHPQEVKLMWNMPKEEAKDYAKAIYKQKYWDAFDCDNLPDKIDRVIFDIAINPGPAVAKRLITESKGDYEHCLLGRIEYYKNKVKESPFKIKYLMGWLNRTLDLWHNLMGV